MGGVAQPVLPMLPADAGSIGASAGLLEGTEGGVVFVFGLATFSYAADDQAGPRLAAVQLVSSKIASSVEVASAFGVSGVTLWKWARDYASGGVAGLVRARSGPKGPIKLTESLRARIVELDATGLTLLQIAARTGVSTATVRVALGRVSPRGQAPGGVVDDDAVLEPAAGRDPQLGQHLDENAGENTDLDAEVVAVAELVVLAAHRGAGRGPVRGAGRGAGGDHRGRAAAVGRVAVGVAGLGDDRAAAGRR